MAASPPNSSHPRRLDRLVLAAFLLAALNGLLYVFLLPPWQHYDEPNHFEYAWLLAARNRFPKPGDSDPKMSRQVLKSMISNNFYRGVAAPPVTPGQPVGLPGYPQLDEPPVYYLLAALPVAVLQSQPVAAQLYGARLVSWLMFLLTVLSGWGIAAQLTRPGHPLRWMMPFTLGMLPPLVDLMTAVNNDVGAVAFYSLFLWGCARLITMGSGDATAPAEEAHRGDPRQLAGAADGPGWVAPTGDGDVAAPTAKARRVDPVDLLINLAWVGGAAILCLFTKVTAFSALVLLPLALLLALGHGRLRLPVWALVGLGVVTGLLAVFSWGDAAQWGRVSLQSTPTRAAIATVPLGTEAFRLDLPAGQSTPPVQLHHVLAVPPGVLHGQTLTVGAWMWADRPLAAQLPMLQTYDGSQTFTRPVELTQDPTFYTYTVELPGDAQRTWLTLAPQTAPLNEPASVYYDGILVVSGSQPWPEPPQFDSASAQSGTWGGQRFTNLVRNASAETTWPRLRPWVDRLGGRLLPDKGNNAPSIILYSLLDWQGAREYLQTTARFLHESLWGVFAWGHIVLRPAWIFNLLALAGLLAAAGALTAALRRWSSMPWGVLFLLGLAALVVIVQVLGRGSNYLIQARPIYYPRARYLFPAITALILLFNAGWLEIGRQLNRWLRLPPRLLMGLYAAGWVALNAWAIFTLLRYYYG